MLRVSGWLTLLLATPLSHCLSRRTWRSYVLVNDLKNTIDEALALLAESVTKLCETMEGHSRRITNLEEALSSYSDRTVDLEEMCASLKNSNKLLANTVDDLENRSRRCNLRVINLAEEVEGTDPVEFMSGFFAEVLGSDLFPTPPILDRAHCLGAAAQTLSQDP